MPETHTPVGRRPSNEATLKHTDLLGGFDYPRADFTKQTFPRHSHEEYLVGVIENGVHDDWCKGEWWHASKDVVATFSPDEAHFGGLGDADAWRQTIFYFPQKIVCEAMDCAGNTYSFHQPFKHSPENAARLVKLRSLLQTSSDRLLLEQEVLETVGQVFETLSDAEVEVRAIGKKELGEVQAFIHDNIQGTFDISTLASLSGFTKRQFMSRFQKQFHIAPYQYVKLAFTDRITYHRNQGARTPELSLPFKALKVDSLQRVCFGADNRTDLEPSALASILEELEDWGAVLEAEPQVLRKLREFEAAASGEVKSKPNPKSPKRPPSRGPSR